MGRPMDGYPQPFGSSLASVYPHVGPASYVAVIVATQTGDKTTQAESGLKFFDKICDGTTDSGTYRVEALHLNSAKTPNGAQQSAVLLRWVVSATNAEVAGGVNLSAEVVRLLAFGPK